MSPLSGLGVHVPLLCAAVFDGEILRLDNNINNICYTVIAYNSTIIRIGHRYIPKYATHVPVYIIR